MGRLADKLARGSDAIAGLEIAVEKDVDKLIARTQEIHKQRERVFLKKHMHLDTNVTDLSEFEKDLGAFDGKNDRSGDGETSSEASKVLDSLNAGIGNDGKPNASRG